MESPAPSRPPLPLRLSRSSRSRTGSRAGAYHGHGWAYRAVFKHDRQGNLLDHRGKVVPEAGNLCTRHADKMVLPLGWELEDLRDHVRAPAPAAPAPAPAPPAW